MLNPDTFGLMCSQFYPVILLQYSSGMRRRQKNEGLFFFSLESAFVGPHSLQTLIVPSGRLCLDKNSLWPVSAWNNFDLCPGRLDCDIVHITFNKFIVKTGCFFFFYYYYLLIIFPENTLMSESSCRNISDIFLQ